MERLVNENLREQINLKLEKIVRFPEYYDKRKELVLQNVRSIGDVYSFWIENPDLRKTLLTENKQSKTIRKLAREGIQDVHNGWYYLSGKGEYGNFIKEFNSEILKKANKLIVPKESGAGEFREKRVSLNCEHYTPPNPIKVPEKVKNLISKVKQIYSYDPLESAITAHLEIAAIQPFMNGNKRTARLIQDRILCDTNLPPAIIQAGEGTYYMRLLCDTLGAYEDEDLAGQKEFYNYCASKVNNGLDEILGDLTCN